MRRRDFVAGSAVSAVVWPLALRAQQPRPRVGVIKAGNADNDATTGPFLKKMEELGWVDGKNVVFDIRHYGADTSLIKDAALGLVTAGASVIVTTGFLAVRTVQAVAPNLPIVAVGGASAAPGFSLAHPGGMVTG
ncbi:MAG: hypothetical protein JOY81_01990, partial [Alphaproteobacteria bacterium]|nr:hypothetical protein [Alphaproteobacteria bacterium]